MKNNAVDSLEDEVRFYQLGLIVVQITEHEMGWPIGNEQNACIEHNNTCYSKQKDLSGWEIGNQDAKIQESYAVRYVIRKIRIKYNPR